MSADINANSKIFGLMAAAVFVLHYRSTVGDTVNRECDTLNDSSRITVEARSRYSPLVLHTLAVYTDPSNMGELADREMQYSAHFWLINVYKGAPEVARYFNISLSDDLAVYNIHDRKINVTKFYRPAASSDNFCWKPITSQKYYILFASLWNGVFKADSEDSTGYVEWSEENEAKVERGLGWSLWTDWAACTITCGRGGIQERQRSCISPPCAGYNKQRRRCNMFTCEGTIEPLAMDNRKFLHPSRSLWKRVLERGSTRRMKSSNYLWLPATEIAFPVADFQKHFALIVSIRVDPKIRTDGLIFSLRSRRQQDTFLSLSLDGSNILRIIQSSSNKTQSVEIPAAIADGHWHQLALGIQDNISVRSYLDCRWVSTDILRNNSLAETEDADLLIGYLFAGDLQLILVPDSGAVVQQCSTTVISIFDRNLIKKSSPLEVVHSNENLSSQIRRRHQPVKRKPFQSKNAAMKYGTPQPQIIDLHDDFEDQIDLRDVDEDGMRGSDRGNGLIFGMKWSNWSVCSASCGIGFQTRYLLCLNLIGTDDPCPLNRTKHVENRSCKMEPCSQRATSFDTRRTSDEYRMDDFIDNLIDLHQEKFKILQKHHIHEEDLKDMTSCKCVNGGVCDKNLNCICSESFTGSLCEIPQLEKCRRTSKCRNGGTCVGSKCTCPQGYTGDDCSSHMCGSGCLNDGVCIGNGICKCPPNVTGIMCETLHCNPPCENGATCTADNECLCTPTMDAPNCAEKKCYYKAVRKPFAVGVRRLTRRKFSPYCIRNSAECASRLIPKFRTVYRTVYRTIYECADKSSSVSFS